MTIPRLHLVLTVLLALVSLQVGAAEISIARHPKPGYEHIALGLKLEGEIRQGDTEKLLAALRSLGPESGKLYLFSNGGSVLEAMKMGRVVRRLRLTTEAPVLFPGQPPMCMLPKPDNPTNCACMSACFLVYAGGAYRGGNHLGLHRPFLSKEEMEKVSDLDFEKTHKDVVGMVRDYLSSMDVPSRFTDIMMSRNSKQLYLVSHDEAEDAGLIGYAPAIEEILLAKCSGFSDRETSMFHSLGTKERAGTISAKEKGALEKLSAQFAENVRCNMDALRELQEDAFVREFFASAPPAAAPVVAVLKAVKAADVRGMQSAYSKRIQKEEQGNWEKNLKSAQASITARYGDYELKAFTFGFHGDMGKGVVSVNHKGKESTLCTVIKEGGDWKIDGGC